VDEFAEQIAKTLGLQRIYVLFFISLTTRRVEFIACTANPDGTWVAQQARNRVIQLGGQAHRFRLLIHDRDRKFSRAFDEVFRSEGIEVIWTPFQAPNANAFAERWVAHRPQRLSRSHPDLWTAASRARPARIHRPLQRAPDAPRAPARPTRRRR